MHDSWSDMAVHVAMDMVVVIEDMSMLLWTAKSLFCILHPNTQPRVDSTIFSLAVLYSQKNCAENPSRDRVRSMLPRKQVASTASTMRLNDG